MKFDVIAIGELLIDFACIATDQSGYPTLTAHPGGAPANLLATVQKLGGKTAFLSKIGTDAFGKLLLDSMAHLGIECRGIIQDETVFTTLAFVTLDAQGERTFSFARKPGADTRLSVDELDWALIDESRVLHFGSLSLTDEPSRTATRRAVQYARDRGTWITFDPNLRPPLWDSLAHAKQEMLWGLAQADVVKLSGEEAHFLLATNSHQESAQRIIQEFGAKLVFLTLGGEGCIFASRHVTGYVPAPQGLTVVDTTGAGDIFGGSAIWRLLQCEKPLDQLSKVELEGIAQFACACAGRSTTKSGAIPSIPDTKEIYDML